MRVLSLGTDAKIFERDSATARRIFGYGELAERYDVIARAKPGQADRELSPKVKVYAAPVGRSAGFVLAALRRFQRLRKNRYDIVTAENPFDVGLAAWLIARASGAAFHLQSHGDFFGSKEWRHERKSNQLRFWLACFLARRADGLRVVSVRVKKSLVALGIPEERITVSPILSELRVVARIEPAVKTILYVGRLETEKNPLLLLYAFKQIIESVPEARLRFVGEGSLKNELERAIKEGGLEASVEISPWTDDLANVYQAASIVAVTSAHEGWGRVAVEAAGAEVPVVMTDVGAAGEFVKDGESGWVVPVGDVAALSKAIVEALTNTEEARRRAANLKAAAAALPGGSDQLKNSWREAAKTRAAVTAPQIKKTKILLLVAALAHLVVFAAFWIRFGIGGQYGWYVLGSDDLGYLRIGANLWRGVFSQSINAPYLPDFDRMPIYPLFLALLKFVPAWTLIAVQQIFSLAGVWLWYKLARRILPEGAAFWSALLFAIEPTTRFWSAQFATEPIFSVFWFGALLAFFALLQNRRSIAAIVTGLLLGLAVLTRPIVLYYPAVFVFVLLVVFRREFGRVLKFTALFVVAFLLVLSPWVARNTLAFGIPAVSYKASGIMFGENAPTYLVWKYGVDRAAAHQMMMARLPRPTLDLPRENYLLDRAVADVVRSDPAGFAYVMAKSAVPFFLGDGYVSLVKTFDQRFNGPILRWDGSVSDYLARAFSSSPAGLAVFILGKIFTILTLVLAAIGAVALFRSKKYRFTALWFALTIAYFAATSGTIAYSRYRFPITPMLYGLAISGVVMGLRKYESTTKIRIESDS